MPEINISVRDKVAAQTGRGVMVCDNSDYVLVFDFDEEWAAYTTKTARLRWNGAYTDVVFDGDRCPCPAISDTALVRVGVYAGDLHTSTPAIVPCLPSIRGGDGAPADPAPDVYDQLMEKLNSMGEVSEEEIAAAVDAYMADNPVAGAFTVHITYDEETDTYSADKTFEEIKAAYDAGQVVQADYDGALFVLNWVAEDFASFGAPYSIDASLRLDEIIIGADGTVYFDTVEAAQADWNQNDENASDYIKNRTHWDTQEVRVMVDTQTVTTAMGNEYFSGRNACFGEVPSFSGGYPDEGQAMTVSYDGRIYTGALKKYRREDGPLDCVGNPHLLYPDLDDTGEPFMLRWFVYEMAAYTVTLFTDTEGEHTIYCETPVGLHPLDEKYIPDSIARKTNIPTTLPNPNKLTLTGAVEAEYDGSSAVTVEIPEGGGDSSLGITGATVGQTVKITEVDDDGRPTAWEAVSVASSEEAWELIRELTIDAADNASMFSIDTDNFGNPFSLKKALFSTGKLYAINGDGQEVSTKGWLCFNGHGTYNSGVHGFVTSNYLCYPTNPYALRWLIDLTLPGTIKMFFTPTLTIGSTWQTDIHEIEVSRYGSSEVTLYGTVKLWGVRA